MGSNGLFQQYITTLERAFRHCWAFIVLMSLLLFSTFFVIGSGSLAENALEARIANRLVVSVFLKPGQTPNKETLQRVRSLPGIKSIELVPPNLAGVIIAQRTDDLTGALTKEIAPNVFPFAIFIQVQRQHLSMVPELLSDSKNILPAIQEVRYPRESLQQSLQTLTLLKRAVRQLSVLVCLVATAGCLTALAQVVHCRQYLFLYTSSGLIAGVIAGYLLCWTGGMIKAITGWLPEFPIWLYQLVVVNGVLIGILGDFSARFLTECRTSRENPVALHQTEKMQLPVQEVES